jgi:hypothetical protein
MNVIVRLVLASVIAASIVPGEGNASPQMERVRAKLKEEAVRKQAVLQSYPNARELQRQFGSHCGAIVQDIERAHAASFCPTGCPNKVGGYATALGAVNERGLKRIGTSYPKILKACLTFAMAGDDDKSSYAMAVMLRAVDKSEDSEWTAVWAASALALGKGVPQNRNDAINALREITRGDMRPEMKSLVLSLTNSLFGL